MQKVTCLACMPGAAHDECVFDRKYRWKRGHAWLMLIEDMFMPNTEKILFNTYLPCENIAIAIVPMFLYVLIQAPTGEVHSASSHM